ncbi:protein of unknown function [Micromonospora pallida]|uniref:DUF397 domain-containing protein n=1 Tax=Micromonospora pallida TaxID=145854 RepID=A0A1C6TBQ8_9ACTN|nr:DUF397 domain-containing protein [Micromonospora pallida]SCL38943.1 protein of unknown function [Micromonospora pallida]
MDLTGARWHKSTKSGGNGGTCVEVADNLAVAVYVRDTKDNGTGPVLAFSRESWRAFVTDVAERA